MQPIREIVKSIVIKTNRVVQQQNPVQSLYYRRLAVMSYADALKNAPYRSPEMNLQCIDEAYYYCEKAVAFGANQEQVDRSLMQLRAYWIPRLKEKDNAS